MQNAFIDSMKKRRTIYHLGGTAPVPQEEIERTIKEAVAYSPSAFNSQSSRVVILFGDASKKVWSFAKEALRKIVPSDQFPETEAKIDAFAAGVGTALIFEDMDVIHELQKAMPLYAANFALWSNHGTGINQFAIWTALAQIGVGASLQHYGNLIEDQVRKEWNIPASWSLIAQMPFGAIKESAGEKEFLPIEERVKVFE